MKLLLQKGYFVNQNEQTREIALSEIRLDRDARIRITTNAMRAPPEFSGLTARGSGRRVRSAFSSLKSQEKFMRLRIEDITIAPNRRSVDVAKVAELAASIREIGLLNPVSVTRTKRLVAGNHRLESCRLLGWTETKEQNVSIPENHELLETEKSIERIRECIEKNKRSLRFSIDDMVQEIIVELYEEYGKLDVDGRTLQKIVNKHYSRDPKSASEMLKKRPEEAARDRASLFAQPDPLRRFYGEMSRSYRRFIRVSAPGPIEWRPLR